MVKTLPTRNGPYTGRTILYLALLPLTMSHISGQSFLSLSFVLLHEISSHTGS